MKQRPRKILHVLSCLNETYGGPLRLVLELSARAEGSFLSSRVIGVGEFRIKDNPFDSSRIEMVPAAGWGAYAYSEKLRPWLLQHIRQFDGVAIHGSWTYPSWAAATECLRAGVPYVYYPHGMLERWATQGQGPVKFAKKLAYWVWRERMIARNARCTFFTTQREQEYSRRVFRVASPERILAPYGLESSSVTVEGPDNKSLFLPPGGRMALFLGRLDPKKNVEFLLEAWRAAGPESPWRLVIAGSGDKAYEARLRRIAEGLGSRHSIQFTGFVSGLDKRYLLQRADWFLLPSLQENFGIAVLEAVEHGCAVAISQQVYLAESFRPQSEVLPLRLDVWSEFLRTRMQDTEWRHRVARDDRAHLFKQFSMDRIVQQWTETFRDIFPQRT